MSHHNWKRKSEKRDTTSNIMKIKMIILSRQLKVFQIPFYLHTVIDTIFSTLVKSNTFTWRNKVTKIKIKIQKCSIYLS